MVLHEFELKELVFLLPGFHGKAAAYVVVESIERISRVKLVTRYPCDPCARTYQSTIFITCTRLVGLCVNNTTFNMTSL